MCLWCSELYIKLALFFFLAVPFFLFFNFVKNLLSQVSDSFNNSEPEQTAYHSAVPPKPVIVEKNENALTRSLISLGIYALLFYFLFDQNVTYIAAILLVIIIHE